MALASCAHTDTHGPPSPPPHTQPTTHLQPKLVCGAWQKASQRPLCVLANIRLLVDLLVGRVRHALEKAVHGHCGGGARLARGPCVAHQSCRRCGGMEVGGDQHELGHGEGWRRTTTRPAAQWGTCAPPSPCPPSFSVQERQTKRVRMEWSLHTNVHLQPLCHCILPPFPGLSPTTHNAKANTHGSQLHTPPPLLPPASNSPTAIITITHLDHRPMPPTTRSRT
jgi:hypothetical protein